MSRDFQYRNEANKGSVNKRELIRKLPLSDMIKFGWIDPNSTSDGRTRSLLPFLTFRIRASVGRNVFRQFSTWWHFDHPRRSNRGQRQQRHGFARARSRPIGFLVVNGIQAHLRSTLLQ